MKSDTYTSLDLMRPNTNVKKSIKRLKDSSELNGFTYRIVCRDELVALYQTFDGETSTGFEVVRIYTKGNPPRETISSNRQFGNDGSKCFFRTQPRTARQYYEFLSKRLKENPNYKYKRK